MLNHALKNALNHALKIARNHALKIALNLLWFCVVLPIGLIRRMTGRGLTQDGWIDVSVSTIDPETFRRQY